jgi:hypothetical protein
MLPRFQAMGVARAEGDLPVVGARARLALPYHHEDVRVGDAEVVLADL